MKDMTLHTTAWGALWKLSSNLFYQREWCVRRRLLFWELLILIAAVCLMGVYQDNFIWRARRWMPDALDGSGIHLRQIATYVLLPVIAAAGAAMRVARLKSGGAWEELVITRLSPAEVLAGILAPLLMQVAILGTAAWITLCIVMEYPIALESIVWWLTDVGPALFAGALVGARCALGSSTRGLASVKAGAIIAIIEVIFVLPLSYSFRPPLLTCSPELTVCLRFGVINLMIACALWLSLCRMLGIQRTLWRQGREIAGLWGVYLIGAIICIVIGGILHAWSWRDRKLDSEDGWRSQRFRTTAFTVRISMVDAAVAHLEHGMSAAMVKALLGHPELSEKLASGARIGYLLIPPKSFKRLREAQMESWLRWRTLDPWLAIEFAGKAGPIMKIPTSIWDPDIEFPYDQWWANDDLKLTGIEILAGDKNFSVVKRIPPAEPAVFPLSRSSNN